jgi:hypothetical protein
MSTGRRRLWRTSLATLASVRMRSLRTRYQQCVQIFKRPGRVRLWQHLEAALFHQSRRRLFSLPVQWEFQNHKWSKYQLPPTGDQIGRRGSPARHVAESNRIAVRSRRLSKPYTKSRGAKTGGRLTSPTVGLMRTRLFYRGGRTVTSTRLGNRVSLGWLYEGAPTIVRTEVHSIAQPAHAA